MAPRHLHMCCIPEGRVHETPVLLVQCNYVVAWSELWKSFSQLSRCKVLESKTKKRKINLKRILSAS